MAQDSIKDYSGETINEDPFNQAEDTQFYARNNLPFGRGTDFDLFGDDHSQDIQYPQLPRERQHGQADTPEDFQYPRPLRKRQHDQVGVDTFEDIQYPLPPQKRHRGLPDVDNSTDFLHPGPPSVNSYPPNYDNGLPTAPQDNSLWSNLDPNYLEKGWFDEYQPLATAPDATNSSDQELDASQFFNQDEQLNTGPAPDINDQWLEEGATPAQIPDSGFMDNQYVNEGQLSSQNQHFDEPFAGRINGQYNNERRLSNEFQHPEEFLAGYVSDLHNNEGQVFNNGQHLGGPLAGTTDDLHNNAGQVFNQGQHLDDPFAQTPIYNNLLNQQTYTHQQYPIFHQNSKRSRFAMEDEENYDQAGSQPRAKRHKLATPSSESVTPAPDSTSKSPRPQQDRKRKTTKRIARKDKVQASKGREHNPKGMIQTNQNGQLQWRMDDDADWELAGYHHESREELIAADLVAGETYDHDPAGGGLDDPLNITSYCAAQRHWTDDKSTIIDSHGQQVMFQLDPPDYFVSNPKVGRMVFRGLIMLDKDDIPVREFSDVPNTLSTHIEAFRLEGLRRCTGMTLDDIRARMPPTRKEGSNVKELQTSQAFTNRTGNWRLCHNIGTWLERDGSQRRKDFIKNQLPDPAMNTTEDLPDLSADARRTARGLNKGKFMNKSRYEQQVEGTTASVSGAGIPKSKKDRARRNHNRDNEAGSAKTNNNHHDATNAVPPPQARVDYRLHRPSSASEAAFVQAALSYTRADYFSRTGEEAPRNDTWESYIFQYSQLQEQLVTRWDATRGAMPALIGVGIWLGGWDRVPRADASEEQLRRVLGWSV